MDKKQAGLAFSFMNDIYPISIEECKLTVALGNRAPRDFVTKLGHFLEDVITSYSIHYTKLYDIRHAFYGHQCLRF